MSSYDPRLITFTGQHEGMVRKAYRCPAGVVTIGYGFTWGSQIFREWWLGQHGRALKLGDVISDADAARLLKIVIDHEYAPPVLKGAPRATPHAKAAAIDMVYNCGPGALKWKWFARLVEGAVPAAAKLLSTTATTAKGRRLPGLVRRRREAAAIMEHNRWPAWAVAPKSDNVQSIKEAMPAWRLGDDDYVQGLAWLVELGFLAEAGRGDPAQVKAAVHAFQAAHPQLTADGILGRATLDQLQRVIDLNAKGLKAIGAGSLGTAGGATDVVVETSGYGEWLIYGSLAFLAIAGLWLAWRYRDEIGIALLGAQRSRA